MGRLVCLDRFHSPSASQQNLNHMRVCPKGLHFFSQPEREHFGGLERYRMMKPEMHAFGTNPPRYGFVNSCHHIIGMDERTLFLAGWAKNLLLNLSLSSGRWLQPLRVRFGWCHDHNQCNGVSSECAASMATTDTGDTFAVFFLTKEAN